MAVARAPAVKLTRAVRPALRFRCDVNHGHLSLAATAFYTTSAPPIRPSTNRNTRMTARDRTLQLQNHLTRPHHEMSNNKDFELGNVFDVKDKVALVTGGGSGIGLMIVQALAVNGAKVYITGRTEEKLERVAEIYGKDIKGKIIPFTGDVSTKEGVKKIVHEIESREKCLCILVNNAGIAAPKADTSGEKTAEEAKKEFFESTNVEQWTDIYATNVVGPYMMSTAFLPLLQKSTETHKGYSGTVINITSISGLLRISQGHFSYNASKGAEVHLNKMLAAEIAKAGLKVRVNSIAPGVFPSEMTTQDSKDNQKSEMPKEHKGGLPSQRPGKEEDMAAAILFAASCQYLNGQTIAVDGGYLIQAGT